MARIHLPGAYSLEGYSLAPRILDPVTHPLVQRLHTARGANYCLGPWILDLGTHSLACNLQSGGLQSCATDFRSCHVFTCPEATAWVANYCLEPWNLDLGTHSLAWKIQSGGLKS